MSFRARVARTLARFHHPQRVFAQAILRAEAARGAPRPAVVVDAPCGHGEVAEHLARGLRARVVGLDISSASLAVARARARSPRLDFVIGDVDALPVAAGRADLFCLVNSLFLLVDPAAALDRARRTLARGGRLHLIVPRIESASFRWFQEHHPGVNRFALDEDAIRQLLANARFEVLDVTPICRTRSLGRKDLRWFWIFAPLYASAIERLARLLGLGEACYVHFVARTLEQDQ